MLLTRKKRKWFEMEKDDKLEKYEEQKKELDEMGHQIMNLKQKLDNFRGVEEELDYINSRMAKLYNKGIVDNEGNLIE